MRIRHLIAALFCALLIFPAQAQKSKSTLAAEINSSFPDNIIGTITPAIVRSTLTDFVNSWQQYSAVNAQVGTSYTVLASDYGQLITFNNSGAIAVSVPQPTGSLLYFSFFIKNVGSGTVTLTPTSSTINGSSTLTLVPGGFAFVTSDQSGINYVTTGLPGYIPAALFPALTGDVTTTAGSFATTIATNAVTNAKAAQGGANTMKGNWSGSTANVADNAMPSCADTGTNHLNYVSGTGVTCGTADGRVLLNTLTASNSASLSDTSSLTSAYSTYELVFTNVVPAGTTPILELLIHESSSFPATSYLTQITSFNATTVTALGSVTTYIPLNTTGNIASSVPGISGTVRVSNPSGASAPKIWYGQMSEVVAGGGSVEMFLTSGFWNGGNTAVDGFQVSFSSGNITSGTIKVYGIE